MAEIIHDRELEKYREIKRLRDELRKNPKSSELHYGLGKLLVMGLFPNTKDEGIKYLEKAIKLKPDFAEALELLFNEIMESNPLKGSRLAQKAASIYKERNDLKKANEILNKAAMHYVYQGWELLDHGLEREALKKAERALKIFPDCVDALNIYGSLHLDRFKFDEAEKFYRQALKKAIEQQDGKEKIKGIIVKMLISYFDILFTSGLWKEFGNDAIKIFQEPEYEYLMVTVWNENMPRKMDYITHKWFTDAYEFCKLYGPLWLKYKDIYDLLMEIEHGVTRNN